MSDENKDIMDTLEEASKEPVDNSPEAGFTGTTEDGKPIKLGEKPEKTKDIK